MPFEAEPIHYISISSNMLAMLSRTFVRCISISCRLIVNDQIKQERMQVKTSLACS